MNSNEEAKNWWNSLSPSVQDAILKEQKIVEGIKNVFAPYATGVAARHTSNSFSELHVSRVESLPRQVAFGSGYREKYRESRRCSC